MQKLRQFQPKGRKESPACFQSIFANILHRDRKMVENDIKKVSKYLKVPVGKLSYTDDHIIQMKTNGDERIVGFSSIINYLHNVVEKENKTSENYFLAKQFFDFANVFIRSTSKRDKCKSSSVTFANSMIEEIFDFRCGSAGVKLVS